MLQLRKAKKRVNGVKLLTGYFGARNFSYKALKSCTSSSPHLPLGIALKGGSNEIQISQRLAHK